MNYRILCRRGDGRAVLDGEVFDDRKRADHVARAMLRHTAEAVKDPALFGESNGIPDTAAVAYEIVEEPGVSCESPAISDDDAVLFDTRCPDDAMAEIAEHLDVDGADLSERDAMRLLRFVRDYGRTFRGRTATIRHHADGDIEGGPEWVETVTFPDGPGILVERRGDGEGSVELIRDSAGVLAWLDSHWTLVYHM